jgi:uncharacterized membrane protein
VTAPTSTRSSTPTAPAPTSPAGARLTREEQKALRNGLERGRLKSESLYGQDGMTTAEASRDVASPGRRLQGRQRLTVGAIH